MDNPIHKFFIDFFKINLQYFNEVDVLTLLKNQKI